MGLLLDYDQGFSDAGAVMDALVSHAPGLGGGGRFVRAYFAFI